MRQNCWRSVAAISIGFLIASGCNGEQPPEDAATSGEPPAQHTPSAPGPAVESVQQGATGQLTAVDPSESTISIRDHQGATQTFHYSVTTEILGASGIEGLAARQGNDVIVTYAEQDNRRIALRVDVIPRQ